MQVNAERGKDNMDGQSLEVPSIAVMPLVVAREQDVVKVIAVGELHLVPLLPCSSVACSNMGCLSGSKTGTTGHA